MPKSKDTDEYVAVCLCHEMSYFPVTLCQGFGAEFGRLKLNAALALSPSGIAPELNRIQLSAICRGGQSGSVIDLLARRCLPLGHPSAASDACAVVQILSSKQ